MDAVKNFFSTQLFAVDGLKFTVGIVVLIVVVYYFFFMKK